jgi:hypothetical protein
MTSKFRFAPAIAVPFAGALALAATPQASAMTAYAAPTALSFAAATAPQSVGYRYYHRWGHRYGAGPAFAFATLGMIAAIAASSSYDDCEWGACGDYSYDYGGPHYGYGGPYYGGWGGHPHWGHWGGHAWRGGDRHAFAYGGGESWWRHRRH